MTKALFYTDYHLANKRPINRIDDFSTTQIAKLKEVYQIAKDNNVDAVLFGGDFFHTHRIYNYELIHSALDVIISSELKTLAVQGQHDLIGHNRESYFKSTLCFLERYSRGYFQTLWNATTIGTITVHPCHWFDNLDDCCKTKMIPKTHNILLAHQSISEKKYPFETILTKNIKSEFDLVLSGDIHSGHPLHTIGQTSFYNPGSLTRMSIKDRNRSPKVALIVSNGNTLSVEEILLKSAVANVFNFNELHTEAQLEESNTHGDEKFFEEIMALEEETADLTDLVQKIARQKKIRSEVVDYISQKMASIYSGQK